MSKFVLEIVVARILDNFAFDDSCESKNDYFYIFDDFLEKPIRLNSL